MTWLERLKNQKAPEGVPTKTTKTVSVVSVGTPLGGIQKFEPVALAPYTLAPVDADPSHPEPSNDAASARYAARAALFVWRGIHSGEVDALAERMRLRDLDGDDRRLCLECSHLGGYAGAWRCSSWQRAGIGGKAVAADLVALPQRCPAFGPSSKDTAAPINPFPNPTPKENP